MGKNDYQGNSQFYLNSNNQSYQQHPSHGQGYQHKYPGGQHGQHGHAQDNRMYSKNKTYDLTLDPEGERPNNAYRYVEKINLAPAENSEQESRLMRPPRKYGNTAILEQNKYYLNSNSGGYTETRKENSVEGQRDPSFKKKILENLNSKNPDQDNPSPHWDYNKKDLRYNSDIKEKNPRMPPNPKPKPPIRNSYNPSNNRPRRNSNLSNLVNHNSRHNISNVASPFPPSQAQTAETDRSAGIPQKDDPKARTSNLTTNLPSTGLITNKASICAGLGDINENFGGTYTTTYEIRDDDQISKINCDISKNPSRNFSERPPIDPRSASGKGLAPQNPVNGEGTIDLAGFNGEKTINLAQAGGTGRIPSGGMFDSAKFDREAKERSRERKNTINNSEAQYGQVGFVYVDYESLTELTNPAKELKGIESGLSTDNWSAQTDSLNKLRSIFKFHPSTPEDSGFSISNFVVAIMKHTESLRSGLSKTALICLNECLERYTRKLDRNVELMIKKL
jgi:hypothetical protein